MVNWIMNAQVCDATKAKKAFYSRVKKSFKKNV